MRIVRSLRNYKIRVMRKGEFYLYERKQQKICHEQDNPTKKRTTDVTPGLRFPRKGTLYANDTSEPVCLDNYLIRLLFE